MSLLQKSAASLGIRTEAVHPRRHDLRHGFAVRALIEWQRFGASIDGKVADLSTYPRACRPGWRLLVCVRFSRAFEQPAESERSELDIAELDIAERAAPLTVGFLDRPTRLRHDRIRFPDRSADLRAHPKSTDGSWLRRNMVQSDNGLGRDGCYDNPAQSPRVG